MAFAVANGYPIFTDAWGKPLSDGYIFIGEKGLNPLSNPQAVYWDEALSIPATNIRTTGGYAMKNGSPGQLFTERPYSILVQNKNGATVFYQPDGSEDEEGKDVVLSEAGEEYLLPSNASVGDRLTFVVKNEAPDAKITQPDGVTIVRGLSQRTVTGETGRFVTRPGQSLRVTNVGEANSYNGEFDATADPSTLPTGNGRSAAWSPDVRYLAVGHNTTPFLTIYDWSSGAPVKIADPATLPTGVVQGVSWSPDGRYLAVASEGNPNYLIIYDWSSGAPVKIAEPSSLPTSTHQSVAWSPDGRYLAASIALSPYITIYDWESGTPVRVADPATLPAGWGHDTGWSPDGRYLAVAHVGSPYVTIYDWESGAPVKISNPATLPAGNSFGTTWSPNGRYLAVAHNASPYITIYDWESGAPVKISNPATLPAAIMYSVAWSPDGTYLAVAGESTVHIVIYDWTSGVPVKIADPVATPPDSGIYATWAPSGRYLTVTHLSTPYVLTYELFEVLLDAWLIQHVDGPEIQDSDFDNRTP